MGQENIAERMEAFRRQLLLEEKSSQTIEKYMKGVKLYCRYMEGKELRKELVLSYKRYLTEKYPITTVKSLLMMMNRFLVFMGRGDLKVKLIKVQRQIFTDRGRALSREEYLRDSPGGEGKGKWREYADPWGWGAEIDAKFDNWGAAIVEAVSEAKNDGYGSSDAINTSNLSFSGDADVTVKGFLQAREVEISDDAELDLQKKEG